jgi:very-short-patch-repair endonuclease
MSLGRARSLADRAVQQSWLSAKDVINRLDTQPGRWGNRQLRRLLPAIGDGADAESERRLQQILRTRGITGWVAHLPFVACGRRFEIDVAFPELKVAIEVDGYRYHSGDVRFQTDRTKQNALVAAGWRVLRFTWADINERPDRVVREIMQLLAA